MRLTLKYVKQYKQHRGNAKYRGVDFFLSYKEWLTIWIDSGHLHERGHHKGQYVMGRYGDKGPYAVGNVKIITSEVNTRENRLGNKDWLGRKHSEETKAKMSEIQLGHGFTEETKRQMSYSANARWARPGERERISEFARTRERVWTPLGERFK